MRSNKVATRKNENSVCTESSNVILPFEIETEYYVEDLGEIDNKRSYLFWKRMFDIIVSVIALIVLAIPMIIILISVQLTSKGSAIYSQDRLGLHGKKVRIIKFRTMYLDAEKNGAQWSSGESDLRITPVGRFLRKYRLDEIPQFFCVLKGDLSIVGPRPEREVFYNEFERYVHGFRERLKVKPGLTGLAQINGGYNLKPEEKIVYDVEYIKKRSLWLDIVILIKTVKVVLFHEGAK